MKMWDNIMSYGIWCITGVNIAFTASEVTDPIITTIQLIISIISVIISIVYLGIRWYNAAKKDGKITSEEIEDLLQKVNEEINKIDDNESEETKNE